MADLKTDGVVEEKLSSDVWSSYIHDLIERTDPNLLIGVGVAIVIGFLIIVVFALRVASVSRRGIVMLGLSESGKTLLFAKLVHKKNVVTQSSIKENTADYVASEKKPPVKLVDVPGHDRLRFQFIDKFKNTARGIIFVVDSLTFQKDIRDVAELMHTVLTDKVIVQAAPAVLVACNKHDQATAKGARIIQTALEKELNSVRVTKSATLQATDGNKSTTTFLGKRNQDFAFSDLRPISVEFVECSARGSRDDILDGVNAVQDWIARVA